LKSLANFPGILGSGADLHDKIWRRLKTPRFKLFQEAFCHPDDWIVPRIERCEWNISVADEVDIPVLACLLSPERVPDKLLHDLELISSAQSSKLETTWLRCSVETITKLKLAWDSSSALLPGRHQSFVVSPPSQALIEYYPEQLPDLPPAAFGVVLNLAKVQAATRQLSPGLPAQTARQCNFDSTSAPLFDGALLILKMPPPQDDLWMALLQLWQDIDESLVNRCLKWREAAIARKPVHSPEVLEELRCRLQTLAHQIKLRKGLPDAAIEKDLSSLKVSGKSAKQGLSNLKRLVIQLLTDSLRTGGYTNLPPLYLITCKVVAQIRSIEERASAALTIFGLDHFLFSDRCQNEHVGSQVEGILRRLKIDPQVISELRIAPFPKLYLPLQSCYSAFERGLRAQDVQASQRALVKYIFGITIVRLWIDLEFQRAAIQADKPGSPVNNLADLFVANAVAEHALSAFPNELNALTILRSRCQDSRANLVELDKLRDELLSALY
jgi:hypothetical protein